jgi:cold shock CspA family protein
MTRRRWRNKDMAELARRIEAAGGTIEPTAGGHYKVTGPEGIVILPSAHADTRHLTAAGVPAGKTLKGKPGARAASSRRGRHRKGHGWHPPRLPRQPGTVTRWRDGETYGFITSRDDRGWFVNRKELAPEQDARLSEGCQVTFAGDAEIQPGKDYPQARAIRVTQEE